MSDKVTEVKSGGAVAGLTSTTTTAAPTSKTPVAAEMTSTENKTATGADFDTRIKALEKSNIELKAENKTLTQLFNERVDKKVAETPTDPFARIKGEILKRSWKLSSGVLKSKEKNVNNF